MTQRGMDNTLYFIAMIIGAIGLFLFALNMTGCRENIVYQNEPDYTYEVCDTVNRKRIDGIWNLTVRCTDADGNERTYIIILP